MDKNLDPALTELVVRVCLAVRQGRAELAEAGFQELLAQEAATKEQWWGQLETCVLTAARGKRGKLLQGWLSLLAPVLLRSEEQLLACKGDFLGKLTFAVCDKRLDAVKSKLQELWRNWLRQLHNSASEEGLREELRLCTELLNLAARLARRGWIEETRYVLRLVAWAVLQNKGWQSLLLWQNVMAQLSLHFAVYARWESFPKACAAYHELVLLLVLLVRRAGRGALDEHLRTAYLQLSLRTVRDLVTNIARSTMQEDMDIFRQWYQHLWQLAGEDARRKQCLILLLQLSIAYWQRTLPKSSKKQLRFLQDLLQPNLIDAEYEKLLKAIT